MDDILPDVDEPLWGIIFRPWQDEPVYHANAYRQTGGWATLCGRPIGLHTPMLPMKHVKKFARPCKGCFPE